VRVASCLAELEHEPASRFIDFLNKSPTPYHVVENASHILEDKGGFVKVCTRTSECLPSIHISWQLHEAHDWEGKLKAGGKYYFTRFAHHQNWSCDRG
jgi:aspartyl aminopeptidase